MPRLLRGVDEIKTSISPLINPLSSPQPLAVLGVGGLRAEPRRGHTCDSVGLRGHS